MPRFTKVSRQEFPATEPTRIGQFDVAYTYMDERFQTFSFTLPMAEDTEENVKRKLQEKVESANKAGPPIIEL